MRNQRAPIFLAVVTILIGGVILLDNFLLIDADILGLWPVLLILLGLFVIVQGDLAPGWQAQTFGITRGSVESASLEINSAEIDVRLRSLNRAGRLIAGQYTARSRPRLAVRNNHALLSMRRGNTWPFSLADWNVELAGDIPWKLLMSAHLGELQADLRGVYLEQAHIATGFGNIRLVCPYEAGGALYVRSTFGDIQVSVPPGVAVLFQMKTSPMSRIIAPDKQFKIDETGRYYATRNYRPNQPAVEVIIAAMFGNIVLGMETTESIPTPESPIDVNPL